MLQHSKIPRKKSRKFHDTSFKFNNHNEAKFHVTMFESKRAKAIIYLSKSSSKFTNHPNSCLRSCFILLGGSTHLAVFGKAKMTHICGPRVTVWGGNIGLNISNSFDIFSPTSHTPISITQCSQDHFEHENHENAIQQFQNAETKLALERVCGAHDQFLIERLVDEMNHFQGYVSVLHFNSQENRVLDSLSEVKRFRFLFHLPSENTVPSTYIAKSLGFTFLEHDGNLGYQVAPEISCISERLTSLSTDGHYDKSLRKVLICGPKGSGKSSLVRFLSNRILTNVRYPLEEKCVAILDCDIGQPEFTPNGMISLCLVNLPLFGPPYTHILTNNVNIVRRCFVGCISPSDDPSFYLKCLDFVYNAYVNLPEPKPILLVNTMGWMQGLGLTLLLEQILLIKPDLIIQLRLPGSSNSRATTPDLSGGSLRTMDTWNSRDISNETFCHDAILVESFIKPYHENSVSDPRYYLGPPDHRDLMMLTYFISTLACAYTSLPSRLEGESLGHPVAHLLDCIPYQVPVAISSKQQDISENMINKQENVVFDNSASTSELNEFQINALYSNKEENDSIHLAFRVMRPNSSIFTDDPVFPSSVDDLLSCLNATLVALCIVPQDIINEPNSTCMYRWISSNPVCECVGLAICRAVDPIAGVIYLTTGVPANDLLKVTGILRGNVNLPNCFLLDQPFFPTRADEETSPFPPYTGPVSTQGKGRAGLPSRRSYPKTKHHDTHRTGTSDVMD
ncbi:Polynucleotide 5'-hydroxyl-kinase grc3 [Schistosoma japonicum]|nr:Polynucleotide 5'-hydroxyl-kinase grc3 [Schistosoma japonicum]